MKKDISNNVTKLFNNNYSGVRPVSLIFKDKDTDKFISAKFDNVPCPPEHTSKISINSFVHNLILYS